MTSPNKNDNKKNDNDKNNDMAQDDGNEGQDLATTAHTHRVISYQSGYLVPATIVCRKLVQSQKHLPVQKVTNLLLPTEIKHRVYNELWIALGNCEMVDRFDGKRIMNDATPSICNNDANDCPILKDKECHSVVSVPATTANTGDTALSSGDDGTDCATTNHDDPQHYDESVSVHPTHTNMNNGRSTSSFDENGDHDDGVDETSCCCHTDGNHLSFGDDGANSIPLEIEVIANVGPKEEQSRWEEKWNVGMENTRTNPSDGSSMSRDGSSMSRNGSIHPLEKEPGTMRRSTRTRRVTSRFSFEEPDGYYRLVASIRGGNYKEGEWN